MKQTKSLPGNPERLHGTSRMSGEVHVRFGERPGVRFPRATRLSKLPGSRTGPCREGVPHSRRGPVLRSPIRS